MIATVDDVLEGFRSLWTLAGMPTLVPGGLFDARKVPAHDLPAAFMALKSGVKTKVTLETYLEPFTLMVWVHSRDGTDDRSAIERKLTRIDWTNRFWPHRRGRCVHVRPVQTPTEASPVKNVAADVAVSAAA
jgi:hypothetical protein